MKRTDSKLRLRRETLQILGIHVLGFAQGELASQQVPIQGTVVRPTDACPVGTSK
jgi:hypothetical protein